MKICYQIWGGGGGATVGPCFNQDLDKDIFHN